jgi:hypothetical protein
LEEGIEREEWTRRGRGREMQRREGWSDCFYQPLPWTIGHVHEYVRSMMMMMMIIIITDLGVE